MRLSFDELSTLAEANAVIAAFAEAAGKKAPALKTIGEQDRLPVGVAPLVGLSDRAGIPQLSQRD